MTGCRRRVAVIINRRAKQLVDPTERLSSVLRATRDRTQLFETHTLAELDAVASHLAREIPDAVFLAGGDGSYMAGATALRRAFRNANLGDEAIPAVGLVPGGTASTVARNWGYSGGGLLGGEDAAAYTARLLDATCTGRARSVPRPTLEVTDDTHTRIGFILGAGLVSRFFELYERAGAGGYRSALAIVARIFASSLGRGHLAREVLAPVPCIVETDGMRAPFARVSLVVASVVRDLGLGMRVLYRAGEAQERFHVVASELGPSALGPQLPLVLLGRPLLGKRRLDTLTSQLRLSFPHPEGTYVLDGELFGTARVEANAGPVLRVLQVPSARRERYP